MKYFSFYLIICLTLACNYKDKTKTNFKPCTAVSTSISLQFSLDNKLYKSYTLSQYLYDSVFKTSYITNIKLDSTSIDSLVNNTIKTGNNPIKKTYLLVGYFIQSFNNNDTLKFNKLAGLGVYSIANNCYYFNLFLKSNNIFNEVKELKGITGKTTINPFMTIGNELVFLSKSNCSVVCFFSNVKNDIKHNTTPLFLEKRLENYLETH
jgi:hypothetical protein